MPKDWKSEQVPRGRCHSCHVWATDLTGYREFLIVRWTRCLRDLSRGWHGITCPRTTRISINHSSYRPLSQNWSSRVQGQKPLIAQKRCCHCLPEWLIPDSLLQWGDSPQAIYRAWEMRLQDQECRPLPCSCDACYPHAHVWGNLPGECSTETAIRFCMRLGRLERCSLDSRRPSGASSLGFTYIRCQANRTMGYRKIFASSLDPHCKYGDYTVGKVGKDRTR